MTVAPHKDITMTPRHPDLKRFCEELDEIAAEARRLTVGLSDAALNWTPPGNDDPWSVGQCLDHLNKTGGLLLPKFETALHGAKAKGLTAARPEAPLRFNLMERWFIKMMQPGGSTRVPVPKMYAPDRSGALTGSVVNEFLTLQERLKAYMVEADGLDLERIKTASPVSQLVRMSLGAWLAATVAHEQYHLLQIARIRETPGFPAA